MRAGFSYHTHPASRLLLALVLLGGVRPLWGAHPEQDPRKSYALIFGTVWGPDDRPVYGVRVKIRRADQKRAKWEIYSNHQGEFAQRLPASKADYVVWADLKGFKSLNGKQLQPGEGVTVHIAGDERQDIGLHLK
jgi:Carboxypeptidase regulatory-like domain